MPITRGQRRSPPLMKDGAPRSGPAWRDRVGRWWLCAFLLEQLCPYCPGQRPGPRAPAAIRQPERRELAEKLYEGPKVHESPGKRLREDFSGLELYFLLLQLD